MRELSAERPLVMGVALHAYIVGQPHRLRHLKRALKHIAAHRDAIWLTTPGAIAGHCASLPAGIGSLGLRDDGASFAVRPARCRVDR